MYQQQGPAAVGPGQLDPTGVCPPSSPSPESCLAAGPRGGGRSNDGRSHTSGWTTSLGGAHDPARVLRLPRRALEARAHVEPDREHVRDGAAADRQDEGLPVARDGARPPSPIHRRWSMVFKLAKSAERHWRRLDNTKRLGQIIDGIRFCDGEPVKTPRVKPPLTSYPKFDHSRSWTLVALELRNRWAGRAENNATFVNGNASIGVRRKR